MAPSTFSSALEGRVRRQGGVRVRRQGGREEGQHTAWGRQPCRERQRGAARLHQDTAGRIVGRSEPFEGSISGRKLPDLPVAGARSLPIDNPVSPMSAIASLGSRMRSSLVAAPRLWACGVRGNFCMQSSAMIDPASWAGWWRWSLRGREGGSSNCSCYAAERPRWLYRRKFGSSSSVRREQLPSSGSNTSLRTR